MSLDNVKHVLLILSGKGGVGKSSVTTQLALSLTLAGKSVGILDIDLTGPSIPRLLGLEDAKITQAPGGWNPVRVHPAQILPHHQPTYLQSQIQESNDGNHDPKHEKPSNSPHHTPNTNDQPTPPQQIGPLYAASLAFLLPSRSSAVIWRGPKKTAMVRQFLTDVLWPPLDYLLIDTPPGTSDEHIALAETLLKNTTQTTPNSPSSFPTTTSGEQSPSPLPHLAGALVVTTPQAVSTSDVKKELNFCRKTGIGVIGVVENMSGFVCECCGERTNLFGSGGGEAMAREFGVRFLGGVPVDLGWGKVVEEGGWAEYGKVEGVGEDGGREDVERERRRDDGGMRADGMGSAKDEANGNGDVPTDGAAQKRREKALLVDRYRSCKLCEVFEGISRRIMDIVETPG